MVFRWGMKEVSSVGNHGRGNPEDSWRTNTLPMPTGLAPPKHHGVFSFGADRQGALANSLHGLNPRNTDSRTHPLICRTALVERLLKNWVQRWKQGPIYKRINPTLALGQCLLIKMNHDECRTRQTLERAG